MQNASRSLHGKRGLGNVPPEASGRGVAFCASGFGANLVSLVSAVMGLCSPRGMSIGLPGLGLRHHARPQSASRSPAADGARVLPANLLARREEWVSPHGLRP